MSVHSDILDHTADLIESLVPLTDKDAEDAFMRLDSLTVEEAEKLPNAHRGFSVLFSAERVSDPFTGQFSRLVMTRGVNISIIYQIKDRTQQQIEPVIAEDGDQIHWKLIDPQNKPTLTGAQFIQYADQQETSIARSESGASLIVTHTVPIMYRLEKY
jgi:hypothetical protein